MAKNKKRVKLYLDGRYLGYLTGQDANDPNFLFFLANEKYMVIDKILVTRNKDNIPTGVSIITNRIPYILNRDFQVPDALLEFIPV